MELKCDQRKMDEEREEGELTDEELEEISDDSSLESFTSLILGNTKYLNREPFKELSLTSVSDDSSDVSVKITNYQTTVLNKLSKQSVENKHYYRHKEKDYPLEKRIKYTKKRKYYERKDYTSLSDSSDSESYIADKRVLRQLRDAVRISSTKKNPNCSLRTRLKRMIEPDSPSSKNSDHSDQELENLRDQALKSKSTNSTPSEDTKDDQSTSINDEDLFNLRLIALQSAILKKHENRKKRKLEQNESKEKEELNEIKNEVDAKTDLEDEITSDIVCNLIDKVNNNNNNNNDEENPPEVKIEENKTSVINVNDNQENKINEEVNNRVDSASNQIEINKNPNEKPIPTEEDEDILRAMLLTSISKKISNKIQKPTNQQNIPTLMTISNSSKPITSIKKPIAITKSILPSKKTTLPKLPKPTVKTNVKLPTSVPVKSFVINLNTDSDSDANDTVITNRKSPVKTNDTKRFEQKLSSFLKEARKKSEQQQSDISKHLPRSQQIEYRHLKRKLQQLSKLKTFTKNKKHEIPDENKRVRLSSISKKINSKTKFLSTNQQTPKTSPNGKNKLINKVDRLNMKGKYEGLAPLMLKISQARIARDKAQNDVKRLINELRNARVKLTSTHQMYTNLIQQLLLEKAELERENKLPCSDNKPTVLKQTVCTSTPFKEKVEITTCEISGIPLESTIVNNSQNNTENEETLAKQLNETKEDISTNQVDDFKEIEFSKKENDDIDVKIDICDVENKNNGFSKYNSPLDHIQQSSNEYVGNPLMVLCPFDLLGVCRDPDCTYRHCGTTGTD